MSLFEVPYGEPSGAPAFPAANKRTKALTNISNEVSGAMAALQPSHPNKYSNSTSVRHQQEKIQGCRKHAFSKNVPYFPFTRTTSPFAAPYDSLSNIMYPRLMHLQWCPAGQRPPPSLNRMFTYLLRPTNSPQSPQQLQKKPRLNIRFRLHITRVNKPQ